MSLVLLLSGLRGLDGAGRGVRLLSRAVPRWPQAGGCQPLVIVTGCGVCGGVDGPCVVIAWVLWRNGAVCEMEVADMLILVLAWWKVLAGSAREFPATRLGCLIQGAGLGLAPVGLSNRSKRLSTISRPSTRPACGSSC